MTLFAAKAGLVALLAALATASASPTPEAIATRDRGLLGQAMASLPRQRPGTIDMYALGFAGDGTENVFRNEVEYFVRMSRQRLGVRGTLALVSHPASLDRRPLPLATYRNLRQALSGLGEVMDVEEDVLLLYLTMHGTPEHELILWFPPLVDEALLPEDLALLLEESGIRHRVLVLSACYSGGFIPALRGRDSLVVAAAREDRASFGCGTDSHVTWFGRAWMVEGLSRTVDFEEAFRHATVRVAAWERAEEVEGSQPQISVGRSIRRRLRSWQDQSAPGSPLRYPFPLESLGVEPPQGGASSNR